MTGEVGAHTNRPELVAVHGYDTKFAMQPCDSASRESNYFDNRPHQPARARARARLPSAGSPG